ncbi:S8 family serine peptidase [Methylobacterium variabile]|uniref:S8 family serine peptidase n=1 Tax=Methylobacterium variabile TaxID=298794 RepID=UPI00069E6BF9|nr:S8 family serine peptidase [Methylobacterium variabile]
MSLLSNTAGVKNVAYSNEFSDSAVDLAQVAQAGMVVFDTLGIAVMDADPDQEAALAPLATADNALAIIEPEPIFFAFGSGPPADFEAYFRGYKDAVDHLYEKLLADSSVVSEAAGGTGQGFRDTEQATWGLTATGVASARSSGRGVRVAILDTGFDLDHPDFRGRQITDRSFIAGQAVSDDNGHGTHCVGTACGPRSPTKGRRYGIAHEAEIFVGKVLSNQGSSLGRSTLAGMEWAVTNQCHIVSMSLGSRVAPGQTYLNAFESIAREALRRNTLIIAAAGNDSRRSQNKVCPVGSPANCPSIMAVGAVDRFLRTADFSNGSTNPDGRVDIAGPGVDIYSSAPEPAATPQPPYFRTWSAQYDTISGTSMATPHVAGIAALLRQENPGLTAGGLWRLLVAKARTLPQPSGDVGAGLVQI